MRSLPILLPAALINARACPLASIRQVRTWRLRFVEQVPDDLARPAGWSDVVEAGATARDDGAGPSWPTELAGDGFRALWDAPRPVSGPVRLRGELVVDPLDGLATTGRIHRLRLVTQTVGEDGAGERVVACSTRDLSAVPKAVDAGDRGVLVDLELGVT
ncbi:hypothetical protein [Actinomycetospora cinnamomea]|uniref:Uncharacterized protein n=1 Tax=Actinomycetospora cinnamomea TaxID=663609 RepID=A0A2U1FQJ7_9PSEU|nr:hypothetical protein [Actinomycetospora cinnamomea]PVZ14465.1 hypothetical protein C8D89_101330 [Actinomycetospora cinnamomea]